MEKRIILTGTPKAVGNILKENRIREKRGEIVFGDADEQGSMLTVKEQELVEREQAVAEREEELIKLKAELAEREKQIIEWEKTQVVKNTKSGR